VEASDIEMTEFLFDGSLDREKKSETVDIVVSINYFV
jgi:hypothetical protein